MKRGELFSQPFIMIFALIIMALIIVFGIRSFNQVKDAADDVELVKFVSKLQEEVNRYYNFDVGSSKKMSLFAPAKAKEICFYDPARRINIQLDEFTKTTIEAQRNANTFFLPLDNYKKTSFAVDHLKNADRENPLCLNQQNGRFIFLIETMADGHASYVGAKSE